MWSKDMGTMLAPNGLIPDFLPCCRQWEIWLKTGKEFNIEKKVRGMMPKTRYIFLLMIDTSANNPLATVGELKIQ